LLEKKKYRLTKNSKAVERSSAGSRFQPTIRLRALPAKKQR
jgi:hypothetical protein